MRKSLIVLPDGTEIYSGINQKNALKSVAITECVNSGAELTIGSVCANMLEAVMIVPGGGLSISAGTEVTLYKVDDSGNRAKVGLFTMEKPTRSSANSYKLTAYDRVSWLDKDLTYWLSGLDSWPYTLYDFAGMVCAQCGLTLANESLPNGNFQIWKFSGEGITGRQLMAWIGEATAKFCRATPDGEIEFAWYREAPASIGPVVDSSTSYYYYQGSLSYEDYQVTPIEKVQIRFSDNDVGVIWPNDTAPTNTYTVTGNYLLITDTTERLIPIAQTIYNALKDVTYTPGKVLIPANMDIHAGDIVTVTDANRVQVRMYIMSRKQAGQRDTLESTGSQRRDSVTLVNNQSYKALAGKVLNLQTSVEGVKIENADTAGKVASLGLDVDGISSQVQQQINRQDTIESQITQIQQSAGSLSIKVQSILDNGVERVTTKEKHYTLDDNGLKISQPGKEIENRLDETGMYVTRSGTAMLQANNNGVITTDLTVRNYLKFAHARFEAYGAGATACFWMQFASGQNILLDSGQTITNNDYNTATYTPSSPLVEGETYTISLCVTPAAGVERYSMYLSEGYARNADLYAQGTSRQIIRATFTAWYSAGRTPTDRAIYAQIRLYRLPDGGTVTGSSTVHWCKVEIGDTPTDWSPAPED